MVRPIVISLSALFLLAGLKPVSTAEEQPAGGVAIVDFDPTYPAWTRVLARSARPDGFDYSRLSADPSDLDRQIRELRAVGREAFERFSRDRKLAFLINAHNVFAVDRAVRHYPIDSLEDTVWPFFSVLNLNYIDLLGRKWSLNELREEVMGSKFNDVRAIFLLNWAMRGCAPLPPGAVTEYNLETMLERQTLRFMRNPNYNRYERRERKFYASPLLDWHREDIRRDYATLWDFLEHFAAPDDADFIERFPPRIRWNDFDETLNDAPRADAADDE